MNIEESIDGCECKNTELRYRVIKQPGRQAYKQFKWQCMNCGRVSSPISHSKLKDMDKNRAKEIDGTISQRYWQDRRNNQHAAAVQKSNEWFTKHNAYLRSGEWKAKRTAVLRRDGYMCQACLVRPATQVHHLDYRYWGNEPLFDLISVCNECHDTITALDRARRNGERPAPELQEQEVKL